MSSQKIKFGDKKVDEKEFYFCEYSNNDVVKPLCVILPQMNGYIKYFDNGGKNMSFVTDDKKVYEKYDEIWNVVKGLLKLKFALFETINIY